MKIKNQNAKSKIKEVIAPKGRFHNFDFLSLLFDIFFGASPTLRLRSLLEHLLFQLVDRRA
jgi:hypothetical protein